MSPTSTTGIMKASLEAVAYQGKSGLFLDLTAAMQKCIDEQITDLKDFMALNLGSIILKHTGMSIQVKLDPVPGLINAMAYPVILDPNSPFIQLYKELGVGAAIDAQTTTHEKILPLCKSLRGSIDLGRSRVSGVFSKLPTTILLGTGLWTSGEFQADEIAAMFLHEIGHVFTYFEMLLHTTTANITLLTAKNDINRMKDQEQRLELVFEVAEFLQVKLEDPKKLADPEISLAEFQAVFLAATGSSQALYGTATTTYSLRSSEVVADQFAARHGAGRALVLGMAKLYAQADPTSTAPIFLKALSDSISLVRIVAAGVVGITFSPAVGLIYLGVVGLYALGWLGAANPELKIYDDPKERLERVRKDLIQTLKTHRFDPKMRDELVREIEDIQQIAKPFNDYRTIMNMLWIYVGANRRQQFRQMRFEQELERLVNNDLFVKAAKLQSLT